MIIMDDTTRFSVLILEKDVLEYKHFKTNFQKYETLLNTNFRGFFFKNHYQEKKMYWYTKYIQKMRYLEKHYRTTKVYTDYHKQIEGPIVHPYLQNQDPVVAVLVEPSAPFADVFDNSK